MSEGFEPFIKGLYEAAPKCKVCGEMREYWDDELCVKCRKKKEAKMTELKPCPFCGSTEVEIDEREEGYGILCRNCGVWATSGWWWFNDSKDAIELWNRRVKE